MAAENLTTLVLSLVAVGALVLGYRRSRPFGKLGLLAWLQSVVLMLPWLLFFGLFALGIYVSFVAVILLFVVATGIYIYLGSQLRAAGQGELIRQRLEKVLQEKAAAHSEAAEAGGDRSGDRAGDPASGPMQPQTQLLKTQPLHWPKLYSPRRFRRRICKRSRAFLALILFCGGDHSLPKGGNL